MTDIAKRNELVEAMDRAIDGCLERGCIRGDTLVECIEAQGLAVVPVEPTEAMVKAAREMKTPDGDRTTSPQRFVTNLIVNTWSAMLAASPLRGEG